MFNIGVAHYNRFCFCFMASFIDYDVTVWLLIRIFWQWILQAWLMEKYKAGMFIYALAFLLGIVSVQQFSVLAEVSQLVLLSLVVLSLYYVLRFFVCKLKRHPFILELRLDIILILLILIGIIYSSFYAEHRLSYQLDDAYAGQDRKSTRLNSSHQIISYAVFCLKKKNNINRI